MLIHDAAAAAVAVCRALIVWLVVAGSVAAVCGTAAVVAVAPGIRAVRRRVAGVVSPELAPRAPESTRTAKRRSVPAWAHTDHHRYEEAA